MAELLKGRVAAITGAASGIGLECARALIEAGVKVVPIDRDGAKPVQACEQLGPNALAPKIDLPRPQQNSAMLQKTLARAGGRRVRRAEDGDGVDVANWPAVRAVHRRPEVIARPAPRCGLAVCDRIWSEHRVMLTRKDHRQSSFLGADSAA